MDSQNQFKFRKGYKYQTDGDYTLFVGIFPKKEIRDDFLRLTTSGYLTIFNGYAWDGPSGPAIDTITFMRASGVHDAIYQLIRRRYLTEAIARPIVDKVMRKICKEAGMCWLRRVYTYWIVRRWAKFASNSENMRKVYIAS